MCLFVNFFLSVINIRDMFISDELLTSIALTQESIELLTSVFYVLIIERHVTIISLFMAL